MIKFLPWLNFSYLGKFLSPLKTKQKNILSLEQLPSSPNELFFKIADITINQNYVGTYTDKDIVNLVLYKFTAILERSQVLHIIFPSLSNQSNNYVSNQASYNLIFNRNKLFDFLQNNFTVFNDTFKIQIDDNNFCNFKIIDNNLYSLNWREYNGGALASNLFCANFRLEPNDLTAQFAIYLKYEVQKINKPLLQAIPKSKVDWQRIKQSQFHQDEVIQILQEDGVIGMGGAGFPSHKKLNILKSQSSIPVHSILINAVECDPFTKCDLVLVSNKAKQVLAGAIILAKVYKLQNIYIAIKENNTIVLEHFQKELSALAKTISEDFYLVPINNSEQPSLKFTIKFVNNYYPSGSNKLLLAKLFNLKPSMHSDQQGFIGFNVATLAQIYASIIDKTPPLSRFVTFSKLDKNLKLLEERVIEVPLGTSIKFLVDLYVGNEKQYNKLADLSIIKDGIMMGKELNNYMTSVTASQISCQYEAIDAKSASLILRPKIDYTHINSDPCINCGDCVAICPVDLIPQHLFELLENNQLANAKEANLSHCIECGMCDFVCPSRIALTQAFHIGKKQVYIDLAEQHKQNLARNRTIARNQRIDNEKQQKELERQRKKQEILKKLTQTKQKNKKELKKSIKNNAVMRAKAEAKKRINLIKNKSD